MRVKIEGYAFEMNAQQLAALNRVIADAQLLDEKWNSKLEKHEYVPAKGKAQIAEVVRVEVVVSELPE